MYPTTVQSAVILGLVLSDLTVGKLFFFCRQEVIFVKKKCDAQIINHRSDKGNLLTMIETVLVSVSGPAFSFLLYENVKSEFDQVSIRHRN